MNRTDKTKSKVEVIFGTRPEAIKLAPVILELRRREGVECRVCVTAQHREMLDQVLTTFGIAPDTDLDLMRPDQTLAGLTARAVEALDAALGADAPDLTVVQGDTTTTLCAALTSFYRGIPVAHVEAGLRSGNLMAPWPEEMNRIVTSRLSTLHFAPTETNRAALLAEGVPGERILVTGNTVIDALGMAVEWTRAHPPDVAGLPPFSDPWWTGKEMVLITGHRRESFGKGFESICRAIHDLALRFPRVLFIYPVHLNPNVRRAVDGILRGSGLPNIRLIDPVSYLPFISLMDRAVLILTDSGGIQEEAPSLKKPVLVMRETTERREVIDAGLARLIGADRARIVAEVAELLERPQAREAMTRAANPYGDGRAAARIVDACLEFLDSRG